MVDEQVEEPAEPVFELLFGVEVHARLDDHLVSGEIEGGVLHQLYSAEGLAEGDPCVVAVAADFFIVQGEFVLVVGGDEVVAEIVEEAPAGFGDFGFGQLADVGESVAGAEEPQEPAADSFPMVFDLMDQLGGYHGAAFLS